MMTEDGRKTCALVVEDDPNIVDLIRSNLAVRGFDTVVSVDGMRALQLLETEDPDIVVGDIVIDLALQQVRRNGQPVHLTPTEFALLRELAVNRGKLLTHAHLLRRVWGHGYETETEYLRVYVRRLRAKLEAEDSAPLILTQPRAGYRLAPE